MNNRIKQMIYITSFALVLLVMIPIAKYIANQKLNELILLITIINLSFISSAIHLYIFKKIFKRAEYNEYSQRNIIFASTVVFLEIQGVPYTIKKKENKNHFSYSVNWQKNDPQIEQLRAIYCSLCIHNYKGITPTQKTRWEIQKDWEENLVLPLTIREKKKLWRTQTKSMQVTFKKNIKIVKEIHFEIQKNTDSEAIKKLLRQLANK